MALNAWYRREGTELKHNELFARCRWPRHSAIGWSFAGLSLAALLSAGCSSDTLQVTNDHGVPHEVGAPVVTVVEEIPKTPDDEQAAADKMLLEAMKDGVMTGQELEEFALETVECTRRAGYVADLSYFNAEKNSFGFSYRTVNQTGEPEPGEDPAARAFRSCDAAFFLPAWDAFEETNPRSEEDIELMEQQRQQDLFDCLGKAGLEFETIEDFVISEDVPTDIRFACMQAYNE